MSAGSNKFGNLFQWSSFGESHGSAMGVLIDGCPAGVAYNEKKLLENLNKRRPGGANVSARVEKDLPEILSGVFENQTLGTPIAVVIKNSDQRSQDYAEIKNNPRVGHADDLWRTKFGVSDYRGGGRASARETVNWVIAGSFAQMFCESQASGLNVEAKLHSVGGTVVSGTEDPSLQQIIVEAKESGDSFGACVGVEVQGVPANLGEPIFKKIKADFASAFMTINACCGVEIGGGFELASKRGSEVHVSQKSKEYGGIRGGITTGENIQMNLAFKPTSSIHGVAKQGRHDPCVAIRALPIVEAMTWNVLADHMLMARLNKA